MWKRVNPLELQRDNGEKFLHVRSCHGLKSQRRADRPLDSIYDGCEQIMVRQKALSCAGNLTDLSSHSRLNSVTFDHATTRRLLLSDCPRV